MKFNIQSKRLLTHLQAVSRVVNSKNTISILDNFLFSLEGDKLVITGSDQETSLTTVVPVENAEGGRKFAANAKVLLDLLKELPDLGLEWNVNDENLEININYLNGHFNFMAVNGSEFPQKAQSTEVEQEFTVPVKQLVKGLRSTLFAVGEETLRPVMMGVYFDIKPEQIVYVASDTHMLVRYTQNQHTGIESSFILPTKPASILNNILDKKEGDVSIKFDSKSATFTADDYTLTCRFVNGRYPNYNSVIPQNSEYCLTIDRQSLLNALRRVSVFASSGGLVRLALSQDNVHLSTQDVDFSTSAEERLQCEYTGEPMTIGFNDSNIIEVLNNINAEVIKLMLLDPARAGIFLPAQQEAGEDLLVLLMPMMI